MNRTSSLRRLVRTCVPAFFCGRGGLERLPSPDARGPSTLFLILLVSLLASPATVLAQSGSQCASDVVVRPGDSLSAIAGRVYGDPSAFSHIVAATNARADIDGTYATIRDPDVLEAGWKLCIPALTASETTTAVAADEMDDFIATVAADISGAFDPAQIRQLNIEAMRQRAYPGSAITVEETLAPGANYNRSIVSYRSDGLKIFALMTTPVGDRPPTGWPVVLFNHGYVAPESYRAMDHFGANVDGLARGHGDSEGEAAGYAGPAYTVDVLNAVAAIKGYPAADPNRIGLWGHSLGGSITLRAMVVGDDIKAGVIWAGMVVSYADLLALLEISPLPLPASIRQFQQQLFQVFGTPQQNPDFWSAISPNSYLADLTGPIQLHHGEADAAVPVLFSMILNQELQAVGQPVELFTYAGDDHNLAGNFDVAIARTIQFFDAHLKG